MILEEEIIDVLKKALVNYPVILIKNLMPELYNILYKDLEI